MTDWSAWQAEQEKQNAELEMLRQKNMATQQAQQQMQGVPMQVFQPYDVTGKGQISGGARNLGTNMWDFMDQAGNVLTSIPLQDFYSRYGNDGSGFYSNKPESINGVQVWNSSSPQAIQQKQGYEAQQAAMQSPGAWVNTGSGFGQVMYDPATGQFLHQQQAINTQPQGTSRISEAASMGWSPSAPGLANQFSTMFGNAFGAPTSSFGSLIDPRYSTSSGGNTLGGYGSAQPSFQAPLLESAFGKSAPDGSYYGLSAMDAQNKSQPSWAGMTNGWTGQAYAPPQTPQVQFGGQAEKMSAAGGAPSAPGMAGQASSMFSNAFGRSSGDVSSDWAAGPSMPPPSAPAVAQPSGPSMAPGFFQRYDDKGPAQDEAAMAELRKRAASGERPSGDLPWLGGSPFPALGFTPYNQGQPQTQPQSVPPMMGGAFSFANPTNNPMKGFQPYSQNGGLLSQSPTQSPTQTTSGPYTSSYSNGQTSFGFNPMNNFFKNYWGR